MSPLALRHRLTTVLPKNYINIKKSYKVIIYYLYDVSIISQKMRLVKGFFGCFCTDMSFL